MLRGLWKAALVGAPRRPPWPFVHRLNGYSTDVGDTWVPSSMPEDQFQELAEDFLNVVFEAVDESSLVESIDTFDVNLTGDGVLEIHVGRDGTYVLNKQGANRQIWLSSPKSGPHRYDFDVKSKEWTSSRDGHLLRSKLSEELSMIAGSNILIPPS